MRNSLSLMDEWIRAAGVSRLTALVIALASISGTAATAAEVKVTALKVNRNLKAGVLYDVTLPYRLKGTIDSVEGCFLWSNEGPYCFPPLKMNSKQFFIKLRTGTSGDYDLTGFLRFKSGGKTAESNRVSARITVK